MTGQTLLPCPFCGCPAGVTSNRDWHRVIVDHGEHCPLKDYDDLMMTPASDDQLLLVVRDWNMRATARQHQKRPLLSAFIQPHPPRHKGFLQPDREVPGFTLEQMKEYGAACVAGFIEQNKL
ncbi:hypothetical protein [Pseudomonas sp. NPDC088444]|uniref:hypothetical protein n=1 Tax=Pseudomonas sp. NPDC088444 TaxID=3364456 RepID=UPI00384B38EB